jgi:hypothetical protein
LHLSKIGTKEFFVTKRETFFVRNVATHTKHLLMAPSSKLSRNGNKKKLHNSFFSRKSLTLAGGEQQQ